MFGRLTVSAVALFLLVGAAVAAASLPPGGTFKDDNGNIHEASIEAIAAAGITKGCNPPTNDRYCPSDTVSRGQMAAFLVRALDLTERLDDPFTDDDGIVFEADIERLAAAGITRGCNPPTNDLFCPNQPVTRGQMAAFLVRAMGYTDAGDGDLFVDDDGSVFEADIDRLGTAGVTKGCNPPVNDMFCPNAPVLRDQMASFLTRALGLTPITPPPDSSTTTTIGGGGTTLPAYGPAAVFEACGTDESGEEFSLEQDCVEAIVYNSAWANALGVDISYRWLDPTGDPVSACPVRGSCTTVEYHYVGASLFGWSMFFYIDGEGRSPGWYTLEIWSGSTADPLQDLLLRDHFELSDIPPIDTSGPPKPDVSWDCSVGADEVRTCQGNTDTSDPADETWACTPIYDDEYDSDPDWECIGDIDKRAAGDETWGCTGWNDCGGNIDVSDTADEAWGCSVVNGFYFCDGDVDKSVTGPESWRCDVTGSEELSCAADYEPWEWSCSGTVGTDWSCSGSVGWLAPVVGPVPTAEEDWLW